jgi:hypothetical protein
MSSLLLEVVDKDEVDVEVKDEVEDSQSLALCCRPLKAGACRHFWIL